jgi:hypothetical protein
MPEYNSLVILQCYCHYCRVVRRIFGPKKDEVRGEWRKLHSEECHNLYSSPDIIRQIKSSTVRWAGCVARMGEERKV